MLAMAERSTAAGKAAAIIAAAVLIGTGVLVTHAPRPVQPAPTAEQEQASHDAAIKKLLYDATAFCDKPASQLTLSEIEACQHVGGRAIR